MVVFCFVLVLSSIGIVGEYIFFVIILVVFCKVMCLDVMIVVGMIVVGYGIGYGVLVFNLFIVLIV